MAIKVDPVLVNLPEYRQFIDNIAGSIDQNTIDSYGLDVQWNGLVPLIGSRLYLQLIKDVATTNPTTFNTVRFTKLYEGDDYLYNNNQIRFPGLARFLVWAGYAKMLETGGVNFTRSGPKEFINDESQDVTGLNSQYRAARSNANGFSAAVIRYVKSVRDINGAFVYPEYRNDPDRIHNKMAFNFWIVGKTPIQQNSISGSGVVTDTPGQTTYPYTYPFNYS